MLRRQHDNALFGAIGNLSRLPTIAANRSNAIYSSLCDDVWTLVFQYDRYGPALAEFFKNFGVINWPYTVSVKGPDCEFPGIVAWRTALGITDKHTKLLALQLWGGYQDFYIGNIT